MADLTYTSGSHTITSDFDTLYLSGTATVTITTGVHGTGHAAVIDLVTPANTVEAIPAIVMTGGTLSIPDGTLTGGNGCASPDAGSAEPGAPALVCNGGSLSISGAGFAAGTTTDGNGVPAIVIGAATAVSISGGIFQGGDSAGAYNLNGGTAIAIGLTALSVTILGVDLTGGAGVGTGARGYALGFNLDSSSTLTLTTGTYTGPIAGEIASGAWVDVYTSVGIVPTHLDGTAFTDTVKAYGHRYT